MPSGLSGRLRSRVSAAPPPGHAVAGECRCASHGHLPWAGCHHARSLEQPLSEATGRRHPDDGCTVHGPLPRMRVGEALTAPTSQSWWDW